MQIIFLHVHGRDVVMMLSAVTDPIGVEERKKHKLKRRVYQNKVLVNIFVG